MKSIVMAMIVAAGIGLAGSAGVSAAPVNGAAIGEAAAQGNVVQHAQHWRWRSRGWGHARGRSAGGHFRWRSMGWLHSRGRSMGGPGGRCHTRSWSRWRVC
jgi:hypothetical protein